MCRGTQRAARRILDRKRSEAAAIAKLDAYFATLQRSRDRFQYLGAVLRLQRHWRRRTTYFRMRALCRRALERKAKVVQRFWRTKGAVKVLKLRYDPVVWQWAVGNGSVCLV